MMRLVIKRSLIEMKEIVKIKKSNLASITFLEMEFVTNNVIIKSLILMEEIVNKRRINLKKSVLTLCLETEFVIVLVMMNNIFKTMRIVQEKNLV